jgi:hypothetical protein
LYGELGLGEADDPMNAQLFPPDPIDFTDPAPYALLEYQGHMIVGAIWFVAALVAFLRARAARFISVRAKSASSESCWLRPAQS